MVRGLNNWQFEDIVAFLKTHGFKECSGVHSKKAGSHHYFERADESGVYWLVHVQYHAGKSIKPGTMQAIVSTSGIPKRTWRGL